MAGLGENEGFHVLEDFVCEALQDPALPKGDPGQPGQNTGAQVLEELILDSAQANGAPRQGVRIRSAGNTELPALLALRAKGYRVWLEYTKVDDPTSPWYPYMPDYQAETGGAYFSATSAVELLGLVALWETRGDNWKWQPGEPNIADELTESARTFDSEGNELPEQ
jgi:hypothetical protein